MKWGDNCCKVWVLDTKHSVGSGVTARVIMILDLCKRVSSHPLQAFHNRYYILSASRTSTVSPFYRWRWGGHNSETFSNLPKTQVAKGRSRNETRVFWIHVQREHSLGKRGYRLFAGRLRGDWGRWEVASASSTYARVAQKRKWSSLGISNDDTELPWALQGSRDCSSKPREPAI